MLLLLLIAWFVPWRLIHGDSFFGFVLLNLLIVDLVLCLHRTFDAMDDDSYGIVFLLLNFIFWLCPDVTCLAAFERVCR